MEGEGGRTRADAPQTQLHTCVHSHAPAITRRPTTSVAWFWKWPRQLVTQSQDVWKAAVAVAHVYVPDTYL